MPTLISGTSPFPILGVLGAIFLQILIEHFVANSGDPDQTRQYAVSDLGMHCLPISRKKDTRLIWVNMLKVL